MQTSRMIRVGGRGGVMSARRVTRLRRALGGIMIDVDVSRAGLSGGRGEYSADVRWALRLRLTPS